MGLKRGRDWRRIGAGAGVSVLVAYLGLFGLFVFTVARWTHEIGIRKVLGARVGEILLCCSGGSFSGRS
ncbi:ABC transporter permease [Gluconobacter sp. P1C6_b]|uniref:ABC transporter permease n=1 Tax=Gluconobacter sp. P1C6_b TaxID=2762619 RepID=UPI001C04E563|nr:hypothetical protein [Gluconobacter sp. P1C6_b]